MNNDVKAKWVAALRSGEYVQGRSRLRTGNTFCCLGVLCDLHSKATGGKWFANLDGTASYGRSRSLLPPAVMVWAGLDSSAPDPVVTVKSEFAIRKARRSLSELNDCDKLPFTKLADLIQEQL
jgi:hypothetical protein